MTDREAFEAWAKEHSWRLDKLPGCGFYVSKDTEAGWHGWQAATSAQSARVQRLEEALKAARDHIACSVCHHDETQRRGSIWTECLQCGGMFADDEGGVPPPEEPAVLVQIRATLEDKQ